MNIPLKHCVYNIAGFFSKILTFLVVAYDVFWMKSF